MKFLLKNSLNIAILYISYMLCFYFNIDLLTSFLTCLPLCILLGLGEWYFENKDKID